MNTPRGLLLIHLRDWVRTAYNLVGLWLLRQALAWPYRLAALKRRLNLPAPLPATPPPICATSPDRRLGGDTGSRWVAIFPEVRLAQPTARTVAGGPGPWRLHRYANTVCASAYVAGLAQAQYHAPTHDIFDASGCLLPGLSFYGPENRLAESRAYARRYPRGLPPAERWPGVTAALASLFGEWNYFHWMLQVLPRFELLRLAGVTHAQVDRYLLHTARFPFHLETLAQLQVPPEKVVATGPDTHVVADYLWATSSLRGSGHQSAWVADFLRREFLPPPARSSGRERLYISRGDAARRRLVNEPDVLALLKPLGFRSITLGLMPVAEQARAFGQASVVIGAHGAGLTNLVFAPAGAKVMELHTPSRRGMHYWELSNARQLEYYYLVGQGQPTIDDKEAFQVSLPCMAALLEMAGVR